MSKLFKNEKFENNKNYKEIVKNSDEQINKKYNSGEVRIVTEQARYPLPTLSELFSKDKYDLHPEFQRRRRWSQEKKSKLIESFIINVPVPPVFLYEIDYASFQVMDGLQRITTIIDFYEDKYSLTGLEEWTELNGKKYSELPERIKEGIDRRYLSSIILLKESAKDIDEADRLKKLVFERLNTGGVKLSPQETRNALYDGILNKLCIDLSVNETFKQLWEIEYTGEELENDYYEIDSNKLYIDMSDVELVLRFFAFRFLDQYSGRLDNFLDNYLKYGNINYDEELLNNFRELFNKTITLADKLFGEKSFRQYKEIRGKYKWSEPVRTIYDPMMQALSEYTDDEFNFEKTSLEERQVLLEQMYKENIDKFSGKKQSKSDIQERIGLINSVLKQLL